MRLFGRSGCESQLTLVPVEFIIPRGKHRGKRMSELSTTELHMSWAGFNGSQKGSAVAKILRRELDRRLGR